MSMFAPKMSHQQQQQMEQLEMEMMQDMFNRWSGRGVGVGEEGLGRGLGWRDVGWGWIGCYKSTCSVRIA